MLGLFYTFFTMAGAFLVDSCPTDFWPCLPTICLCVGGGFLPRSRWHSHGILRLCRIFSAWRQNVARFILPIPRGPGNRPLLGEAVSSGCWLPVPIPPRTRSPRTDCAPMTNLSLFSAPEQASNTHISCFAPAGKDVKAQAKGAAKSARKATGKKLLKPRFSVTFHRPNTLKHERKPKAPRTSVPKRNKLDQYAIIKYPLTTESAMKKIEDNNTLVSTPF